MYARNRKIHKSLPLWITAGLFSLSLMATQGATAASAKVEAAGQNAVSTARKTADKKRESFNSDAVSAVQFVDEAIDLLKDGKQDEAISKLEAASGKLEVAMAANPDLKLIPVATSVTAIDLVTTPERVKADLELVEDLLDDGDVQTARSLLSRMRSEIVTTTAFIPLDTYPDTIKRAVREIAAHESKKAEQTLLDARDSLVEDRVILPLPVVRAQGAIDEAEQARESDKDEALRNLDYASSQLKIARRLGYFYTDTAAYRAFKDDIENLKHALQGTSKTEQLFDRAKNSVNRLLDKFHGTNK